MNTMNENEPNEPVYPQGEQFAAEPKYPVDPTAVAQAMTDEQLAAETDRQLQAPAPPQTQPKPPPPKPPKKTKRPTKAQRLQDAAQTVLDVVAEARAKAEELQAVIESATDELSGLIENIETEMDVLRGVREEEYQSWWDNMSEGLQASPTGAKLEELLNIDLEPAMPELPDVDEINFDDVESAAQEILDCDLPVGFGRD